MQTSISSYPSAQRQRSRRSITGFTLVEVVVALVLISMLCVSIFASIHLISKLALNSAIRVEAYRLAQAEAERLESVGFASAAAYTDQVLSSSLKTAFRRSTENRFEYSPTNASGRVTFTRRVVDLGSTSTMKNFQVEVDWTWQGQKSKRPVSLHILRYQ